MTTMVWIHVRHNLTSTFSERASEWACALMLFFWALRVNALPDLFASHPAFSRFDGIAPQEWWAFLALVTGVARLIALAINGAWRRSYHMRGITAFLTCFFWMQISISLFMGGGSATGVAIYPVLLALDTFHVFRAAAEARDADAAKGAHGRATHGGTN